MPTVLMLTPAVSTALSLFAEPGMIFPSSTLYPSAGILPGVTPLTLTSATPGALTLTPA